MPVRASVTVPMIILAFVGVVWLLRTAEPVLAPMFLALVLGVVAVPLTDRIDRVGLPRAVAAFVVVLLTTGFVVFVLALMRPVVEDAIEIIPKLEWELRRMLAAVQPALDNVEQFQERLQDTLTDGERLEDQDGLAVPSPLDALWYAPGLLGQTLIFVGTLYFFQLSRTELYRAIHRDETLIDGEALRRAEAQVSRYFLTITLINASFGILVAVVLSLFGMPVPLVWGLAAFMFNYILYLGPMIFACILLVAGIILFAGVWSFVPALVYVAMNATEGQFITPTLVGRQMAINPLLIFVSLVFWLWLWGPLGGFIAIPLLVWGLQLNHVLRGAEPA